MHGFGQYRQGRLARLRGIISHKRARAAHRAVRVCHRSRGIVREDRAKRESRDVDSSDSTEESLNSTRPRRGEEKKKKISLGILLYSRYVRARGRGSYPIRARIVNVRECATLLWRYTPLRTTRRRTDIISFSSCPLPRRVLISGRSPRIEGIYRAARGAT